MNQNFKNSQQAKVQDQRVSQVNSTKYLGKDKHQSFSNYLKNKIRGRNTSKLILWSQNLIPKPDKRYHIKEKLQSNTTDEYKCKIYFIKY